MVRKEPASAGFLLPEKRGGTWPFPCKPKEVAVLAVLWEGLTGK